MSTTLTLSTSKLIYDLVGEYETKKRWREYDVPDSKIILEQTNDRLRLVTKQSYPAPTFAELIRVLPRIGEKKEWWGVQLETEQMTRLYQTAPTEPEGMAEVEKYLLTLL